MVLQDLVCSHSLFGTIFPPEGWAIWKVALKQTGLPHLPASVSSSIKYKEDDAYHVFKSPVSTPGTYLGVYPVVDTEAITQVGSIRPRQVACPHIAWLQARNPLPLCQDEVPILQSRHLPQRVHLGEGISVLLTCRETRAQG